MPRTPDTHPNVRLASALALATLATAITAPTQQSDFPLLAQLGKTDHLPPEHRAVLDLAEGDLDGDGNTDVVLLEAERLVVLRNRRDGIFADWHTVTFGATSRAGGVALFDLEGDGDLDVVFACMQHDFGILRNLGNGTFQREASPVRGMVRDLAAGDIDGDGDVDVFAAMSLPPGVSGLNAPSSMLFENAGSGGLVDASSAIPTENRNAARAEFLDADGDGDLDLFIGFATEYLGPLSFDELWLNDGTGQFTPAPAGSIPVEHRSCSDVAVGDVDGDGDPDLLISGTTIPVGGNGMTLWRNDGNGIFQPSTPPGGAPVTGTVTSVGLVDVDADGDLDALAGVTFRQDTATLVFVGDGSGSYPIVGSSIADDLSPTRMLAFRADPDGLPDLLLGEGRRLDGPRRARLLIGDSASPGAFRDATESRQLDLFTAVAAFDFNRDGHVDLLGTGPAPFPMRLLLGDGDRPATDVSTTNLPRIDDQLRWHGTFDADGDGPDDIWMVVQGAAGQRTEVLLCDDQGMFSRLPTGSIPTVNGALLDIEGADLDNDGEQDLLVQNSFGIAIWRGTGPYTWAEDTRTQLPSTSGRFVVTDVDGDGFSDLLVKTIVHLPTDSVEHYRNLGDGTFALQDTLPLPRIMLVSDFQLADADGDGDTDLFVIGNQPTLYRSQLADAGVGRFGPGEALSLPDSNNRIAAAIDVDLDGDIDLVGAEVGARRGPECLLNDGAGNFVRAEDAVFGSADSLNTSNLLVADLGDDGDPDLLFGTPAGISWLTNLRRETRIPYLSERGRLTRIEWRANPGETLIPAIALGGGNSIAWPPFGSLRLDLLSLTLLPPGTIPQSGVLALEYVVPDAPAMVGVELNSQAFWFDQPLRWGNRAAGTATR